MWYVILLAVLQHTTGQACYQGWVNERDSCYKAIFTPLSWQHASTLCESMSAKLVTLNDLTEQTRILELRPEHPKQLFWIGYHKQAHDWRWPETTNSSFNHLVTSNKSYAGRCAAIDKKGAWLPVSCDKKLPFFCEVEAFDCPVGDSWIDVGPQCLLVVKAPYNWYEARKHCHSLKSELAILGGQNPTLVDHIGKKDMAWAGLVYDSTKDRFVWMESRDSKPYPNVTLASTTRCGVVRRNSTEQLEIQNTSCSAQLMSVCEKTLTQVHNSHTSPQSVTQRMAFTTQPVRKQTDRRSGGPHNVLVHQAIPTKPARGNLHEMNTLIDRPLMSGNVATQAATYDKWTLKMLQCFRGNDSATKEDCVLDVFQSADPFCDVIGWHVLGNKTFLLSHSVTEFLLKCFIKYVDSFLRQKRITNSCEMTVANIAEKSEKIVKSLLEMPSHLGEVVISKNNIDIATRLVQIPFLQSVNIQMPGCLVTNISSSIKSSKDGMFILSALLISSAPYKTSFINNHDNFEYSVVSPILTLTTYVNDITTSLAHTFTLFHNHRHELAKIYGHNISQSEIICAFYIPKQRVWSSWGCELLVEEEYTSTCRCNHTTSFALLMKINSYKVPHAHEVALSVITSIGCSISMITMFIALTIFTCVRSLNSERVYVHRNLCLAILCAQVAFLAGIKATEHKTVCRIAAIILHYCYTAVFTWMFVEGMHLYTKVVQVYGTTNSRTTYYLCFGWGIPLLLVTISAVADIEGYGSSTSCWLSIYRKTIWAFVGPAIAVITVNVGILAMVLNIVISSTRLNQPRHVDQIRAGVKAAVVLLPILGLTWLFGLLAINKELIVFEYLFALFNSLQGFFVFLFHCLLNSEVRDALRRLREQHALQDEISDTPSSLTDTQDKTEAMTPRATIQIRAGVQLYLPVEQGTSSRNEGRLMKPSKGFRTTGPSNQEKVVVCTEFKTGVCNTRIEDDLAMVYM